MIVAYNLSGNDNGAYFFENAPSDCFCKTCGCKLKNKGYLPSKLTVLKKQLGDITYTYDNRCIISKKFKRFCETHVPLDIIIEQVNNEPDLFLLNAKNRLIFDVERRKTTFDSYCEDCEQYAQIAGAIPGFLKEVTQPIEAGFFITDVEFGSYKEISPSIIVGIKTKELIIKEGITGAEFQPVYGIGEKVKMPSGIEL